MAAAAGDQQVIEIPVRIDPETVIVIRRTWPAPAAPDNPPAPPPDAPAPRARRLRIRRFSGVVPKPSLYQSWVSALASARQEGFSGVAKKGSPLYQRAKQLYQRAKQLQRATDP